MVGNGILKVCLGHPDIEQVLLLNRKPSGISNPGISEIILGDFSNPETVKEELKGYDACFYCIGITSLAVKETAYRRVTHDITLSFASCLASVNPEMTFCYVSGYGADLPGKAKFMQARVKGITETDLFLTSFKKVYSFRPGLLKPVKGQQHIHFVYHLFYPFYPAFRFLMPGFVLSLKELGLAMINSVKLLPSRQILEVGDIVKLAKEP